MDKEKLAENLRSEFFEDVEYISRHDFATISATREYLHRFVEDIADYILDNFVAKEDVERDYERRENWDCGLTFSKSISKKLGVFHDWDVIDAEISRLKEIEKKWDMQEICKEAMTKGIAFSKVDAIKQEPQTKVYAIASDFERLKELEKSGKPQDSKPREYDPLECDPYRDCPDRTDLLIVKPYKTKPDMTDFDNPTGDGSPLKITAIKNGKFITEQVESVKHKEVEQISPDRPNYFICKHCGKPTPKLPDVPEKLGAYFGNEVVWKGEAYKAHPHYPLGVCINSLIDCYSALKKIVEEKEASKKTAKQVKIPEKIKNIIDKRNSVSVFMYSVVEAVNEIIDYLQQEVEDKL